VASTSTGSISFCVELKIKGKIFPIHNPFSVTASERSERGGLPINVGAGLDPAPFIILGNHKGCPYNIIFRGNRDCFGIIIPRNDPFLVTASERSERGGLRNDWVADFFYTHP